MAKSMAGGFGVFESRQESFVATNSYVPRHSSGRSYLSILLPVWSRCWKYSEGTSVVALQNGHWNLRPPSVNCITGDKYALHLIQRTGPISPRLTTGGGYSPSAISASGHSTRPKGTPVCFFMSGLSGMLYMLDRM